MKIARTPINLSLKSSSICAKQLVTLGNICMMRGSFWKATNYANISMNKLSIDKACKYVQSFDKLPMNLGI